MARTINFVRERRKNLSNQEQEDRKVLKYVTYGLFGLGAVITLIVAAKLFLLFQIKVIKEDQKEVEGKILALEGVEEKYTIFASKLKVLTELFGKRKEKQDALLYFSKLFGENVRISQLSYTAGDEVLSFVLQSTNIFTMEEVFTIMNSDAVKERYPLLQKNTLRRGNDGAYGMQVTLVFADEVEEEVPAREPTEEALPDGDLPESEL